MKITAKSDNSEDIKSVVVKYDEKDYTLNCPEGLTLTPEGKDFFVAVEPATNAALSVTFYTAEDKMATRTRNNPVTLAAKDLLPVELQFNNQDWENKPIVPEGFVDLGLTGSDGTPLYWAEKNLGADNPGDFGSYYAWGQTTGYKPTELSFTNSFDWESYCGSSSFVEWSTTPYDATSNVLLPTYDAATNANSSWRTPTKDDFEALAARCVWMWTDSYYGAKGYLVYKAKKNDDRGKAKIGDTWNKWDAASSSFTAEGASEATGYSVVDTHIFLPAAGGGVGNQLSYASRHGGYWSSSLCKSYPDDSNAYGLGFYEGRYIDPQYYSYRSHGLSVRPVTGPELD